MHCWEFFVAFDKIIVCRITQRCTNQYARHEPNAASFLLGECFYRSPIDDGNNILAAAAATVGNDDDDGGEDAVTEE